MADFKLIIRARGQKTEKLQAQVSTGLNKTAEVLSIVRLPKPPKSRAERLAVAESLADEAKGIVEELKDEMEQWRDGTPENLQGGDKYSSVSDCCDALEEIHSSIEGLDFSSVDFPGMF